MPVRCCVEVSLGWCKLGSTCPQLPRPSFRDSPCPPVPGPSAEETIVVPVGDSEPDLLLSAQLNVEGGGGLMWIQVRPCRGSHPFCSGKGQAAFITLWSVVATPLSPCVTLGPFARRKTQQPSCAAQWGCRKWPLCCTTPGGTAHTSRPSALSCPHSASSMVGAHWYAARCLCHLLLIRIFTPPMFV